MNKTTSIKAFKTLQNSSKISWSVFSIIIIGLFFGIYSFSNASSSESKPELLVQVQTQEKNLLPSSTTKQIVKHEYYTLSYNEKYEHAEWVAYQLKMNVVKNKNFKRPYFIVDPKVGTGSADWRNYKNSGYDKGHLCPAGDMQFSLKAFNETFYTSNISPQDHDFNGGVWNRLEQKTRYWADKYGGVYVVTAGVLQGAKKTIGIEKVLVPEYFYKIVLRKTAANMKMIAFLVPNKKSDNPLYSFVVSVDSIEAMTGIDFFPQLEDKLESQLEKSNDYKSWSF